MLTTTKGEFACLKFEQLALEKGGIVSKPTVECVYDRILDYRGTLYKIQIKYAGLEVSDGAIQACIGKAGKGGKTKIVYDEDDFDVLIIYIPQIDKICWFNKDIWLGKKKLQLRYKPTKNNQIKDVKFVDDYIW